MGNFVKRTSATYVPVGCLMAWPAKASAPTDGGWLEADGQLVSKEDYPELFAVIGTRFGGGSGTPNFGIPDLQGLFLRGLDRGRGRDTDAGRSLGSVQPYGTALPETPATATLAAAGEHNHGASGKTTNSAGAHTHTVKVTAPASSGVIGGISDGGTVNFKNVTTRADGNHTHNFTIASAGAHTHNLTVSGAGMETRPPNIPMTYYIRAV